MEDTPRWLRKEVMVRHKRYLYGFEEEVIRELVEALKKLEPPVGDAQTLAFVMSDQNQDLFTHVFIPPLQVDIEDLTPKYYQIKEVFLGKPIVDTTKFMVTTGIK